MLFHLYRIIVKFFLRINSKANRRISWIDFICPTYGSFRFEDGSSEIINFVPVTVGILDLSNISNTNFIFIFNWYFRVKVLTFGFGCSKTLNSKCRDGLEVVGSLVNPQSFVWWLYLVLSTLPVERKWGWRAMTLFFFGWWKTKVMETLTPRGYL